MRFAVAAAAPCFMVLLQLAACGQGSGAGGAGSGGGDGKLHPPGNGMAISEADACNTLSMAQDTQHTSLGCAFTSEGCPDLLRAEFVTQCLQYDQGSVQGCVTYYSMAQSCSALNMAISNCVVTPIDNSAPSGCP
jgi:hypothetical protein